MSSCWASSRGLIQLNDGKFPDAASLKNVSIFQRFLPLTTLERIGSMEDHGSKFSSRNHFFQRIEDSTLRIKAAFSVVEPSAGFSGTTSASERKEAIRPRRSGDRSKKPIHDGVLASEKEITGI